MAEATQNVVITELNKSLPTLEDFFYNDLEGYDSYQLPETSNEMFYQEAPPETAEFLGYSANGALLSIKVPKTAFDLSVHSVISNSVTGNSIRLDLSQAEYDGFDSVKNQLNAFKNAPNLYAYYATIGADNKDLYERNGMAYAANLRFLFCNMPDIPRFTSTEAKTKDIIAKQYGDIKNNRAQYNFCSVPYPYTISHAADSRNGTIWSCPNYNTSYEKQEYQDTDTLYFITKDSAYYQVIPLEEKDGKTNILVLQKDNTNQTETERGYIAKSTLIKNIEEAKDIRVVLDVNSLTNRASSSTYLEKYPKDYTDKGFFTKFTDYIKDLGNQFFDDRWYKYAGYVPYGLDQYHRIYGVIYIQKEVINPETGKKDLVWYNLNKMMIAEASNPDSPSNSNNVTNQYHIDYGPSELKPYTYNYNNRCYVDNFWEEAGTFEKRRRQVQAEIFRNTVLVSLFPSGQDDGYKTEDDVLYKWTVSLGDTTFFIPPESIRVVSQHETDRVPLMRARGTVAKDRMRSMQYVELNLYFNDERGINGVPYEVKSPNGEQTFTYKMNGFRSLLAQMKFTPFLPIVNQYINETLGIFAVCIENININTVPGFPKLLHAQILLSKFNYQVYMPEIPLPENDSSISENTLNPFSACIDYDTMRWYYQRCIMLGDELDRLLNIEDKAKRITVNSLEFYKKTIFANRTALLPYHFTDSTIDLYIADEDHLKRLLQIKQDAAKKNENVSDNFTPNQNEARFIKECSMLTSNLSIPAIYAKHIGKINALLAALYRLDNTFNFNELVEDGSGIKLRLKKDGLMGTTVEYNGKTYQVDKETEIDKFIEDWIYGPIIQEFKDAAANITNEDGEPIIKSVYRIDNSVFPGGTIIIKLNTNYLSSEELQNVIREATVYIKNNGTNIDTDVEDIFKDGQIALEIRKKLPVAKTFKNSLEAIQELYGSSSYILPEADKYYSLPILTWCNTEGADIIAANEEASALKQSIDLEDVHSLKYNKILENVYVSQASASVGNTYARIGVSGVDGSAPQYMGGQDTKLHWSIETKDEYVVSTFKSIPELTAYYSRTYRKVLPTYPIKIDSEFTRMMGVQEVSIDNVVVSTVENFPGLYRIIVNATSVDRTLRNKEALKLLEIEQQGLEDSRKKKQVNLRSYKDLEKSFSEAEIYPDLELPKISELGKLGWRYIRYRAKERNKDEFYVDPDFYFVYPQLTAGRAILQALRCTFDEKLRAEIKEEDITQYLTDTTGGQRTVRSNGGIDRHVANEIAKEDEKDRQAIKVNAVKQDRLYYTDILKSAVFRIPFGSWDICKTIRCVFMEPYYLQETEWNQDLEKHTLEISADSSESEYLDHLAQQAGPNYKRIRFIDKKTGEEIVTQVNPNWNEEESNRILNLASKFDACTNDLENYLKTNDGSVSSTGIIADLLKWIGNTKMDYLPQIAKNAYTQAEIYKAFSNNKFWEHTSKYNIFGENVGTTDNPFGNADMTGTKPASQTEQTASLADISYLIQAAADAVSGKEECSSKNKTKNFGHAIWQADFNKTRIANGEEVLSSIEDVKEKSIYSFGIFGIKKYTFDQLYTILPPEEKKELEESFEKDNEQFYVLDPYWRYKSIEEKSAYLYACAMDPLVCMNAFVRIVIWYFAKLLRYRVIPSIEFDVKRQENINAADASKAATDFLKSQGVEYQTPAVLFTELKAFAQNNGKAFDTGKLFAAIILALTGEGFGKNTIFDMYNTRNYNELNRLIRSVTSLKYKVRNENDPTNQKRNQLLRRYLLALYGYDVIPDPNNIGSDVKASPADKFLTNYNTKLALEACNNPVQYIRDSFYDAMRNDYRGRMLRAFPTFYMVFVDEGREFGLWKLHDNFYNINALYEIQIVKSRKIAADTCKITMSNMFQTFTTNDEDCTINYKGNFGDLWESFFNPKIAAEEAELKRLAANKINRAKLQTGVRIHVRMGYGANAADLPCCFNGVISEIKPGELVEVIAQGDGIELCNPVYLEDSDEIQNADKFLMDKTHTSDNCLCGYPPKDILQGFLTAKGGGMAAWLRNQYRTNKGQTKESAEKLAEENATNGKDRLLGKVLDFDKLNDDSWIKYGLLNIFKNNPYGIRHFGDPDNRDIFLQGEPAQNLYEITNKTNSVFADDLSNKVYFGDGSLDLDQDLYKHTFFEDLDIPYIAFKPYGKTIWEIMHICKSIAPDYMTGIADFQFRSTVFLGKPHYYYAYKYKQDGDNDGKGGTWYEKRKPFQQWHLYNNFSDIIENKISASSEKMKTNATGAYVVESIDGEEMKKTAPMWVDQDIYPEYQKSMVVDTKLFGKSWFKHNAVAGYLSGIPIISSLFNLGASVTNSFLDEHLASWFDNRGSVQSHSTMAEDAVIDALKISVKEMYQGYLIVLGDPSVKPNDRMHISDVYEDMSGLCDIREVIHTMSAYNGFTTTITPDAISAHDIRNEITKVNTWFRFFARVAEAEVIALAGGAFGEYLFSRGQGVVTNAQKALEATEQYKKYQDKIANAKEAAKAAKKAKQLKKIEKMAAEAAKEGTTHTAKTLNLLKRIGLKGIKAGKKLVFTPAVVGTIALEILCGSVNTALYRTIKGMQVLYIFPLRKFGKAFTAGLDGQQGLVYGTVQFNTPGPVEQLVGYLFGHTKDKGLLGDIKSVLKSVVLDEQVMDMADRFDKTGETADEDFLHTAMTGDTKTLTETQLQSIGGPQLEKAFNQPNSAFALSLMPRTMVDGIQRTWTPSVNQNKETIWQAVKNRYYVDNPETWPVNPNIRNLVLLEDNIRLKPFFESEFLKTLPQIISAGKNFENIDKDNLVSYSITTSRGGTKQILGVKRTEKQKTGDAIVVDIPYTSQEGLVFLIELCKFIQANTNYFKQQDFNEAIQQNKDTSIIISSALLVGSAHPLYGSGFHLILTGTGKLSEDGALKKCVQQYYDILADKLKQQTSTYDHLPMFSIDKMDKDNEVGISIAPTSPFGNNIVAKEEFKFEEKKETPTDTATEEKNEKAKPLDKDDYPEHVYFSPLDELGRAGMAYANINNVLIQKSQSKPRQDLGTIYPSGWKQISYNKDGQTKYLYNRAHLIAHSLCGEEANPANLITGTADFNAGENRVNMNTYEKQIAEYCKKNPTNNVLYKVTPVYDGDNLVASYVMMEATDTTLNKVLFSTKIYNTQAGWEIDYRTGNAKQK